MAKKVTIIEPKAGVKRRLISNIKVLSADEIMIQFKSGTVMNRRLSEEW